MRKLLSISVLLLGLSGALLVAQEAFEFDGNCWGTFEWANFEREMKKILPDRRIVDVPHSHAIFHVFYDSDKPMQVPNIGYAYNPGTPTWEQDGYEPYVRGIFDDGGRLLVFINHNTDLMDASEWADDPLYPQKFAAYSYKIFSNAVVYALSH